MTAGLRSWRRCLGAALALVGVGLALGCALPAPQASAPTGERPAVAVQPAGPAQGAAAAPAQPQRTQPASLRLHLPSRSTSYLPWYLAIERGYFKEQNLDVEILQA